MQIVFNDQTVKSSRVQDMKDFDSQSLETKATRKENNQFLRCLLLQRSF